jgi:glycosyltransferase involved in cell wall biosynthesis
VRILIVTPYLPHARVGHGGGTAVRDLIAALARRHEVAVVSLLRSGEEAQLASVRALGVTVQPVRFLDRGARGRDRWRLAAARLAATARAILTGRPYYVAKYAHRDLARTAIAAAAAFRPHVIQVEYLQLASCLRDLQRWRGSVRPQPCPRLVLDSHELGSLPRRRRARTAPWPQRWLLRAEAAAWDRLARDASRRADTTLCVTEQDRRLYEQAGGRDLVTVPLGVDTRGLAAERDPDAPPRVLFVGSFQHPPNRDAARLLCERIWPAVSPRLPGWRLVLAGRGSDAFLADLARAPEGVEATGFVDDLTPLFRSSRIFAAPLTEGGGIKIKILEAMARGIPVVTTPIGAEGITGREDDLVGWAEDPPSFAETLVHTAHHPAEAVERAGRARAHVEEHFSWEAVVGRLERIYAGD